MRDEDRFELLLEAIDDLVEANESIPIVVEGQRDVQSLRDLGCRGSILLVHTGATLFNACESIAKSAREVILFPDWDRQGARFADELAASLSANGVRVDLTRRDAIRRGLSLPLKDVESLAGYVERGLVKFKKTSLSEWRGSRSEV